MSIPNEDDWRLQGQDKYLLDVQLMRSAYSPPRPDWDHDHCEFCWAKFMDADGPKNQRVGYKTVEGDLWICDDCFGDFKSRFRWTIKS